MLTKSLRIGSLFGFPIKIDLSWLLIAALVTWSLAVGYFPRQHEELSTPTLWIMGVVGMLGLFGSVLLHELGHALVARRYGLEMGGITLFVFGGVAEMQEEPRSPKAEFWVAVGGPAVSLALAAIFWGMTLLPLPVTVGAIIGYLAFVNSALLIFNLIPAFPLDGGRVLRAWLWHHKGSLRRGTRVASDIGSGFGLALIILGFLQLIAGALVGGIWWIVLGLFMRGIAKASYQQVVIKKLLEGTPVERFMTPEPITVDPQQSLSDFVENTLYRTHHKLFPVVEGSKLAGVITPAEVSKVERSQWDDYKVEDVMSSVSEINTLEKGTDATDALTRFNKGQRSRALVIENDAAGQPRLVGILTLKDLMGFLSLKMELEEDSSKGSLSTPAAEQALSREKG